MIINTMPMNPSTIRTMFSMIVFRSCELKSAKLVGKSMEGAPNTMRGTTKKPTTKSITAPIVRIFVCFDKRMGFRYGIRCLALSDILFDSRLDSLARSASRNLLYDGSHDHAQFEGRGELSLLDHFRDDRVDLVCREFGGKVR